MMKNYKHIIFDLDGTLTDSKPGILNAAFYALKEMGVEKPPMKKLNELIGIPLQDYFRQMHDFTEDEVTKAVVHFRVYYGEKGVYENTVYEGIPELLKELNSKGKKIYISTAKYEKYAKVMIDFIKFTPLLTDLIGADAGGKHATKSDLAADLIVRNNIKDLDRTIVIGDKHMDIEAGHKNNIDSIGLTYGFGSVEEIENANPTFVAHNVEKIKEILL